MSPARLTAYVDSRPGRIAVVIGVDHRIQHYIPDLAPNAPQNMLRLRYQDFITQIIGGYPIDVVCEESKYGLESIAEAVAKREQIAYRNIDMSPKRRQDLGIPSYYSIKVEGSELPQKEIDLYNTMRESHMVKELLLAISLARAVIVICGGSHMPVLAQTLQSKFDRVEDYDVTIMPWFNDALL